MWNIYMIKYIYMILYIYVYIYLIIYIYDYIYMIIYGHFKWRSCGVFHGFPIRIAFFRKVFAMGWSLGGNIVVNALAEQGSGWCGWQDAMGKDAKIFMKMIEHAYFTIYVFFLLIISHHVISFQVMFTIFMKLFRIRPIDFFSGVVMFFRIPAPLQQSSIQTGNCDICVEKHQHTCRLVHCKVELLEGNPNFMGLLIKFRVFFYTQMTNSPIYPFIHTHIIYIYIDIYTTLCNVYIPSGNWT